MLNHSKSMAELQRWGKKMQNARSRTPALSDSARKDTPCEPIAISTPRLRLTHKFSSYFLSQTSPSKIADLETLLPSRMSNDTAQSVSVESTYTSSSTPPRPIRDAERCIDMLNAVFLEAPWQSIDAKHVGTLLSIFEAYRMLRAENDTLVERLEIVTRQYSSLEQLQQKAYEEWHTERAACKQEIKRLELVISKGERGLAGVTEARQGSLLRRGPKARREQHEEMEKETVFEFLRASKKEDDMARDKEKAVLPNLPRGQETNAGAQPGGKAISSSASDSIRLVPGTIHRSRQHATADMSDMSSAFSSSGDLLPDEIADRDSAQVTLAAKSLPIENVSKTVRRSDSDANIGWVQRTSRDSNARSSLHAKRNSKSTHSPISLARYRVAVGIENGRLIHEDSRYSFREGDEGHFQSPMPDMDHRNTSQTMPDYTTFTPAFARPMPLRDNSAAPRDHEPLDRSSTRTSLQGTRTVSGTMIPSPTFASTHSRVRRDGSSSSLASAHTVNRTSNARLHGANKTGNFSQRSSSSTGEGLVRTRSDLSQHSYAFI